MEIYVHSHALKHGLTEDQILFAWSNFLRRKYRKPPDEGQILAVGIDSRGNAIQLVAAFSDFGILIFHAMTPPTKKALEELGMDGRSSW